MRINDKWYEKINLKKNEHPKKIVKHHNLSQKLNE